MHSVVRCQHVLLGFNGASWVGTTTIGLECRLEGPKWSLGLCTWTRLTGSQTQPNLVKLGPIGAKPWSNSGSQLVKPGGNCVGCFLGLLCPHSFPPIIIRGYRAGHF